MQSSKSVIIRCKINVHWLCSHRKISLTISVDQSQIYVIICHRLKFNTSYYQSLPCYQSSKSMTISWQIHAFLSSKSGLIGWQRLRPSIVYIQVIIHGYQSSAIVIVSHIIYTCTVNIHNNQSFISGTYPPGIAINPITSQFITINQPYQ